MALTASQKSDLISVGRQISTDYENVMDRMNNFILRLNAIGGAGVLVDGDFIGSNAGIPAADFGTATSTFNTMLTAFTAGHRTNLEKIRQ